MRLFLLALLLGGSTMTGAANLSQPVYISVTVMDSRDRFVPIYMDKALTIPSANPFIADESKPITITVGPRGEYKVVVRHLEK